MKELIEEAYEEEAEVYLGGFGFLPPNPRNMIEERIKKCSMTFCLLTIGYLALNWLLSYPMSIFLTVIGVPIVGDVVEFSTAVEFLLKEFNDFVSFAIILFVGYRINKSFYKEAVLFKKITDYKFLIGGMCLTTSFWVVANLVAIILEDFSRIIGVINAPQFEPIFISENISRYSVITLIFMTVLQEIFFRGVVLFKLREFGDTCAIVCSSLLFALLANELLLVVKWFILGLPLGYLTLKSSNVKTAIILRLVCSLGLQFVQILLAIVGDDLTYTVVVLVGVSSMLFGLLAYFRLDVKLVEPDDNYKASDKVLCFVLTSPFVIFAVLSILKAQLVLQFIV